MCGFVGQVNFNQGDVVSEQSIQTMLNTIKHRGPDESKIYVNKQVGLGFARLSIIDLVDGSQPMLDQSQNFVITFNGEIYNYQQLKGDLTAQGVAFKTKSDTEVLLELFKKEGVRSLSKLKGMFAFCIYDIRNQKITIARDHFGIKPMYFYKDSKGLAFASELKAILALNRTSRDIDFQALDSYFSYGYIMSPNTIYKDVKKINPGHYLQIDLNDPTNVSQQKYWTPTFVEDHKTSYSEFKSIIKDTLSESVRAHLISDVPVGAFLSGGLDSSSVVSLIPPDIRSSLKTFTIGFSESGYNESEFARESSLKYGTQHYELKLKAESALEIEKFVSMYDEPFADSSAVPTYFVSKLAAEHVKVVLSGDGGDELFGGYEYYKRLMWMRKIPFPYLLRHPLFTMLANWLPEEYPGKRFSYTLAQKRQEYFFYFMQTWDLEKKKLFHKDIQSDIFENQSVNQKINIFNNSASDTYFSKIFELDVLTYMTDDILTKVDRASMANSLEVRVPIIDKDVFKVASSVPLKYKIKDKKGKYILRETMQDNLTENVFLGKKRGFAIPVNKWFKSDFNEFLGDHLNSALLKEYISADYIDSLLNKKDMGSLSTRIWPLIMFSSWLKQIHNA
ncbi:MAG: asparagine synthase (glutamine-hydrolyzing) [Bacteroidales bacterium]|nr:asparagine synthase (glutamine-hydrolyzing) [Bacteroidales bacterium]